MIMQHNDHSKLSSNDKEILSIGFSAGIELISNSYSFDDSCQETLQKSKIP